MRSCLILISIENARYCTTTVHDSAEVGDSTVELVIENTNVVLPLYEGVGVYPSEPVYEGVGVCPSGPVYEGVGVYPNGPVYEGVGVSPNRPVYEGVGVCPSRPFCEGIGLRAGSTASSQFYQYVPSTVRSFLENIYIIILHI